MLILDADQSRAPSHIQLPHFAELARSGLTQPPKTGPSRMLIGAFGPRNSMKIEQPQAIIQKAGSGEIEDSLENLNPIECLVRSAQSSE